jgi:hypothetical protein
MVRRVLKSAALLVSNVTITSEARIIEIQA